MRNPIMLVLECMCVIPVWLDSKGQIIDFPEVCMCGEVLSLSDLQELYDVLPEEEK